MNSNQQIHSSVGIESHVLVKGKSPREKSGRKRNLDPLVVVKAQNNIMWGREGKLVITTKQNEMFPSL